MADLLRELGDSAAALAPIFADGKVDAQVLACIGPALQQLGELMTAGLQLHRLTAVVLDAKTTQANVSTIKRA